MIPQPQAPNSLKISPQKLQQQFQCTICLNTILDAYITRCGHVYCKGCIEQAINRHHRCPFCNQQLKDFKADVFKNYHFNTIRKIVDEEKKYQTNKYLTRVFNQIGTQDGQGEGEIQGLMRPIQKRIVEMCQDALLHYRKFLVKMYELEKQTQEKKVLLGIPSTRTPAQIVTHLSSLLLPTLPSPTLSPQSLLVPTTLHLTLLGNKAHKTIINLSPMSSLQSLLPYIQKICLQNNLVLKGKIGDKLVINGVQRNICDRLGGLCGQILQVEGGILLQERVFCWTYGWGNGKIGNFYTCRTCNVKWICETCSLYCHAGHQCQVQINNHKPDWAICYCVTKCDCKAYNKNKAVE